jgi:hypothetical protein
MPFLSRHAQVLVSLLLGSAASPAFAQGGLPPGAIATARAGTSRPHIVSVSAVRLVGAPGTCANRDAMVVLTGLNFPPASAGLSVALLRPGGAPLSTLVATTWTPARIDARLAAGVELEGETLSVGLVDAHGVWQSNTDATVTLCLRDAIFIDGDLVPARCADFPRTFTLVVQGPAARYEKTFAVPAHPGSGFPFRFDNVKDGTYGFTVTETAVLAPPVHLTLPDPGARPGSLHGCRGPSLGFTRVTARILRPSQRRATGLVVGELVLDPPLPPAPGGIHVATPTPNAFAPRLDLHPPTLPTPTPSP